MYNVNEKGFLIGYLTRIRRIFNKVSFKRGLLKGAGHDSNWEQITLIACICADGSKLSPGLIYARKTVQDIWLQDYLDKACFFTSTKNSQTNKDLAYNQLERVFQEETKAKACNSCDQQLLIINGYGSYVTLAFINFCYYYRILLCVFPAYLTYQL